VVKGVLQMKKILILVLMVLCVSTVFAQRDMTMAKEMTADVIKQNNFNRLESVRTITLNTTASINFVGSTATGTTAVAVPEKSPFMLKIHNHNVGSLTYTLFAANAVGVTQPTATSSHLLSPFGAPVVSGKAYQQIFHSAPNISIGASGATEVIVECWTQGN